MYVQQVLVTDIATGEDEEADLMTDLLHSFEASNIPSSDKCTIAELIHIADQNINNALTRDFGWWKWSAGDNANYTRKSKRWAWSYMYRYQSLHIISKLTEDNVNFCGLENMHSKVLEVKDWLLCPEVQAKVAVYVPQRLNPFGVYLSGGMINPGKVIHSEPWIFYLT